MVTAQQRIAAKNGCHVTNGKVINVVRSTNEKSGFSITVELPEGKGTQEVTAKKIVLAPGAYVNLCPWLLV